MSEETKDFSEEFQKLHEDSSYTNEHINTELDDTDDPDIAILKQGNDQKKKDKKKKKHDKKYKKDKLRLIMEELDEEDGVDSELHSLFGETSSDGVDDFLISKKTKKGKKKDLFDIKEAKKKRKKNIESKFAPQITMLKKILKDADTTATDIRAIVDKIISSKSRYTGKGLTDLLQALNTSNSNRASIVRDISNINKTILDLTMKQEKNHPKKEEESQDMEEYGVNLFRRLLSGNTSRRDMMNSAKSFYSQENNEESYMGEDEVNSFIDERLENENNERRTDKGTQYIQYEPMEPHDVVMYHTTTGTWEMDAVDKNSQRMPTEYPRLSNEDVGKIRIDLDQHTAFDEYGRKYPIIEIP